MKYSNRAVTFIVALLLNSRLPACKTDFQRTRNIITSWSGLIYTNKMSKIPINQSKTATALPLYIARACMHMHLGRSPVMQTILTHRNSAAPVIAAAD